jgi:peptidoglycan/LPS O-acetylase OafA/YrhL
VQNPSSAFSAVLEWKPLVWIGQRSYGLYLWQALFILAPVGVPMPVRMGLLLLWSVLTYEFFESPLRDWGRRVASSRRVANPKRLSLADEGAVTV